MDVHLDRWAGRQTGSSPRHGACVEADRVQKARGRGHLFPRSVSEVKHRVD